MNLRFRTRCDRGGFSRCRFCLKLFFFLLKGLPLHLLLARSAAALAHSLSLASGVGVNVAVTMEGTAVAMANRYPTLASIDDALLDLTGFSYDPTTGVFTKDGATTPANCSVTYVQAPANGSPAITVDVSDC